MSNIRSSKKRAIQSRKRRLINTSRKSMIRTLLKKIYASIDNNEQQKVKHDFPIIQSIIDRQASKGIIHKNKAARYKSCLIKKINSM